MKTISDSEIEYIVRSCSLGMRNDGRGPFDYRNILVESDIFPHCAGSSRVTIGSAVDVICGVKVSKQNHPVIIYSYGMNSCYRLTKMEGQRIEKS